jgi:hypothetical protein
MQMIRLVMKGRIFVGFFEGGIKVSVHLLMLLNAIFFNEHFGRKSGIWV